jgi:hypothetical protein
LIQLLGKISLTLGEAVEVAAIRIPLLVPVLAVLLEYLGKEDPVASTDKDITGKFPELIIMNNMQVCNLY